MSGTHIKFTASSLSTETCDAVQIEGGDSQVSMLSEAECFKIEPCKLVLSVRHNVGLWFFIASVELNTLF